MYTYVLYDGNVMYMLELVLCDNRIFVIIKFKHYRDNKIFIILLS